MARKKILPKPGANRSDKSAAAKKDRELDLALNLTHRVLFEGAYSSVVPYTLLETELSSNQRNYVSAISLGLIENYIYLDYLLARLVNRSMKKKIKLLLLLALYEIEFMPHNAAHITVNRYVEFAKANFPHAAGFMNAVLRNHLRKDGPKLDLTRLDEAAIYYSHPLELAELWEAAYGREEALAILRANSQKPRLSLRVNTRLTTREELLKILEEEGLKCRPSEHSERVIIVDELSSNSIEDLASYYRGLFYVQDLSSVAFIEAIDIEPGSRLLDLCAAPGGKSLFMAEKPAGTIVSCDITEAKVELIERNARRLKLGPYLRARDAESAIKLMEDNPPSPGTTQDEGKGPRLISLVNDAAAYRPEFEQEFDVVLCDVPCSGLGVIRKKPEIKYRKEIKSLGPVLELQARILENAAHYVKRDGLLIYSTCTTNPAENEEGLARFLATDLGADYSLTKEVSMLSSNAYSDGFYYAVMSRKK